MKKKPSRFVRLMGSQQLFWVVGLLLLFVLTFWWIPGDGSSNSDSYSTGVAGKHAFYQGTRTLYRDVFRSVDSVIPEDANTIVMLGPVRIPSEDEWDELHEFVSRGGHILYAADPYSSDFSTGLFGVSLENTWTPPDAYDPDSDGLTFFAAQTWQESAAWSSTASLKIDDSYKPEVLVSSGGGIQAVRLSVGRGSAVFVASDVVFQNRSMLSPKSQVLASGLLELTHTYGRIYFDESLSSSGTPRVLGILFTPLFRPLSLQMLLISVLFGWWGSRRFGAAVLAKNTDRRAIVEHAQALGNMHYKVGTASHALRAYFEYFRGVAQVPGGRLDKVAGVLAARSGVEQTEVERLLTETQKAIQNPAIGAGTAATLIQQLANLRDRMMQFGERTENRPA